MTAQSERPDLASSNGAGPGRRAGRCSRPDAPLVSPFAGGGLIDVFRRRYLLKLIVQKEIRPATRARCSGLLWSYVQPLVRFCMYFFVIGLVLGLHK